MSTRILAVEDDERIRTAVRLALEDEGWEVTEAATGEDALQHFQNQPSDVVLIDIMLPGIDGFEVCRSIRRTSDVPIVMVTARADTHDVVAGLEAGADDYLTKPFAPKELSARIRALLRRARTSEVSSPHLRFGDLESVPDEGVVRRNGRDVPLTKTEFRVLVELAQSPGRVFSREVLLERIWGYGYFGDGRLVDVHVRRLRTKVEADPANPRHVVDVARLLLHDPGVLVHDDGGGVLPLVEQVRAREGERGDRQEHGEQQRADREGEGDARPEPEPAREREAPHRAGDGHR